MATPSDVVTADDRPGAGRREPDVGALPRGTTIDRYVLIDRVGKGGMGVVYSAYDHALHRRVAVKVVTAQGDAAAQDHLVAEARAMAQLAHPAIVPVYDVGTFRGQVFLAMAFVAGGTLREWQQVQRPARDIVAMYVEVGGGLAFAHDAGVVHRDFKPDNVLVDRDGRPAITDFGLAKLMPGDPAASMPMPAAPTHTIAGKAAGTPGYMSPQQCRGEPTDAQTDQYAFCVSLFEALHGVMPAIEPPPRADVPRRVLAAIKRGLADEPGERWPSMRALLAELAPPAPRWRALAAAVAVACVAAAAVVVAVLVRSGSARATCDAPGAHAMWDAARPAVTAALAAYPRAHGDELVAALDRWTGDWTEMAEASCHATQRALQSPQLLDLRTRCLDHELDVTSSVVALARTRDPELASRGDAIGEMLPKLEACADTAGLLGTTPPPADPVRRAELDELRTQLASAEALVATESYQAASARLAALAPAVRDAAFPPLTFEALATRAHLELSRDQDPQAAADAAWAAIAADPTRGDYELAAVWIDLVWIVGELQSEPARALEIGRVAEAIADRVHDDRLLGRLDYRLGTMLVALRRVDDAITRFDRAVREYDAAHDERGAIAVLQGEANVAQARGDIATRIARLEQAVARARRMPRARLQLATMLDALGTASWQAGRLDDASATLRDALAAVADASEDPLLAASIHGSLGGVLEARHDPDAAAAEYQQQLDLARRGHDADSSDVEIALFNVGHLANQRHHFAEAAAALRDAFALYARLPAAKVAGGAYMATPGAITLQLVYADLDLQHPAEAVVDAERGVALVEHDALGPAVAADAHDALAEAAWAAGDRERARAAMRQTAADHRAAGDAAAAADDDAWLAKH